MTHGYPAYLLPFLGTAKTLGVITVLVPSVRRLKEWAYGRGDSRYGRSPVTDTSGNTPSH